jgi:hypothetical protein
VRVVFVGEDEDHHAADKGPFLDGDLGGEPVEAFDGVGVTVEELGSEVEI